MNNLSSRMIGLFFFFFLVLMSPAGEDVGAAGVERSGHAGLLRPRAGFRRRHRVLQLQQERQQLSLWRCAGFHHQLRHLHLGHLGGVCCPGLQSEHHEWEMCCWVSTSNRNNLSLLLYPHKHISSFYERLCRNAEKILGYLNTGVLSRELIPPHINFSHLSAQDYSEMYGVIETVKEDNFNQLGLDACILEDELNKVRRQTFGLQCPTLRTFLWVYCLHEDFYMCFLINGLTNGGKVVSFYNILAA